MCGDVTLPGLSELSNFSVSDKGRNNKMEKIRCCTSGLRGTVATATGVLEISLLIIHRYSTVAVRFGIPVGAALKDAA